MSTDNNALPVKFYKELKCRKVEWLWYPYIPYGKITILQGDPGEGKSTLAINIAALLSNGATLPFTSKKNEPCVVVYQNNEDGKEDTICPRLNGARANLNRIAYIDENDASLSMDDNRLEKVIESTKARLLILDPLQSYVGDSADMNRASAMRPILNRLAGIAQRQNCAVLLIGHMSKATGSKGLYRGLGSIDIPAAARSVLIVSKFDDGRCGNRIMAHLKSNLAPLGESIVFSIRDNGEVQWIRKSKLTAEQIINDPTNAAPKTKTDMVMEKAVALLTSGDKPAKEMQDELLKMGVSLRTIKESKARYGIKSIKRQGIWYWTISGMFEEESEDGDE